MALILLFAIQKEKCLVLSNRPTDRSAKLIQVEFLGRTCEKALRIQARVPQELVQTPMKTIASGLRRKQHCWPRASSVLRGVVIGQNLKLLNRVDRREDRNASRCQLVVVNPVDQPVRSVGT